MHGKKSYGAGLRPHKNNLIGSTQIGTFKMDTKALFIACWLADLIETSVSSSLIALGRGT